MHRALERKCLAVIKPQVSVSVHWIINNSTGRSSYPQDNGQWQHNRAQAEAGCDLILVFVLLISSTCDCSPWNIVAMKSRVYNYYLRPSPTCSFNSLVYLIRTLYNWRSKIYICQHPIEYGTFNIDRLGLLQKHMEDVPKLLPFGCCTCQPSSSFSRIFVNFIYGVDAIPRVKWRIERKGEAVYHFLLHIVFGVRLRLCFYVIQI